MPLQTLTEPGGHIFRRAPEGIMNCVREHVGDGAGSPIDVIEIDRPLALHLPPDKQSAKQTSDARHHEAST
jgi:hypothetical protein